MFCTHISLNIVAVTPINTILHIYINKHGSTYLSKENTTHTRQGWIHCLTHMYDTHVTVTTAPAPLSQRFQMYIIKQISSPQCNTKHRISHITTHSATHTCLYLTQYLTHVSLNKVVNTLGKTKHRVSLKSTANKQPNVTKQTTHTAHNGTHNRHLKLQCLRPISLNTSFHTQATTDTMSHIPKHSNEKTWTSRVSHT